MTMVIREEPVPYGKNDFAWARWTPKNIVRAARRAIAEKRSANAAVRRVRGVRTFLNTVYPLELASTHVSEAMNAIHILLNMSPNTSVRTAAKEATELLQRELIGLAYDEGVYRAVAAYAEQKEPLAPDAAKLLRDMLRDYRRMGFGLAPGKRAVLKKNLKELAKLQTAYSRNLNDYEDAIYITREELAGLPEGYVSRLTRRADRKYAVTLRYPDLFPFLQNAENDFRREELARKSFRRGGAKGIALLRRMIVLREKNARLLGYPTHADYQIEPRMAKTRARARRFVLGLLTRLDGRVRRELAELTAVKRKRLKDARARLEYFDIGFYGNRLKRERYGIDTEAVRQWFSPSAVKRGTFAIYERIFKIRFRRISGRLWHQEAELYEVRERSGRLISYFALDLHPRAGKYGHAAVFPAVVTHVPLAGPTRGERRAPFSAMATNFPKGGGLSHDEVETFFHEFGHIMHSVLSRAVFASQAGFNVALDFAEAPSQMFESWVWNPKTLALFSGRVDDPRRRIPRALAAKLIRTKFHMIAYWSVRQLVMALYDLELHGGRAGDITGLYAKLVRRYTGLATAPDQLFAAGWTHMVEYDAGYYGYMWSRVYGADMFTRFARGGALSSRVGMDYRREILEKGSSEDENALVRNFLGRKPNNKAFLREIGL